MPTDSVQTCQIINARYMTKRNTHRNDERHLPAVNWSQMPLLLPQTKRKYGDKRLNLLRACLRRELILLGRQRFLYIFRTCQARQLPARDYGLGQGA